MQWPRPETLSAMCLKISGEGYGEVTQAEALDL